MNKISKRVLLVTSIGKKKTESRSIQEVPIKALVESFAVPKEAGNS